MPIWRLTVKDMSSLSLVKSAPASWPTRVGNLAVGVGSGGQVATVSELGVVRTLRYRPIPLEVVAVDGDNTDCEDNEFDQLINLEPAGAIAAYTVTLPDESVSEAGQEVLISTSQDIATLTIAGATYLRGWTPGLLAAEGSLRLVKLKADTWAKV